MTDPSLNNSGSAAWSTTNTMSSLGAVTSGMSADGGSLGVGGDGSGSVASGRSGGAAATAGGAGGPGSPSRQATAADLPTRLAQNAATLRYLRQCHTEVLSSLTTAQSETQTLQTHLAKINSKAQTEHANLERARAKLEDALYVNAHLREENEMIKTDDERWAFQVEQREEQLESLTDLLAKLEKQQAEIDERKRLEEAAMVRRLEEERAEMVRMNMLAERERLAHNANNTGGGGNGNSGGSGGMPILPKGTGEMSSMLALAPEWKPRSISQGGGAGTASSNSGGGGGGGGGHDSCGGFNGYNGAAQQAASLSEAIAIEPNVLAAGTAEVVTTGGGSINNDDAATTVSALTADM